MTSTIVPPVDLAPGMPSRVVTISATDVTEGGQSLEGQMVRFALSDTLDVSSGGDVIAKTQAEVVLDSNGEGSIRLPVYDEDVKTWCGKDWAILVTATWGSQKAIRVPAGTSSIALSALPSVRPLRGRELQWAVTGATATVTEGAQWDASVSLSGGVLDFDFTVPPGATAWWKGATSLTSSANLDTIDPGVYTVSNGTVATGLGLPESTIGVIEVYRWGTGACVEVYRPRAADGQRVWQRTLVGSTWSAWARVDAGIADKWDLTASPLPADTDRTGLANGTYSFWNGAAALSSGMPTAHLGTLTSTQYGTGAGTQMWLPRTDPAQVWVSTKIGSSWTEFTRVGGSGGQGGGGTPRGFRTAPLALTRGRGGVDKPATGSVRFPTGWNAPITRWRIHMQNVNPRYGTAGTGAHEVTGFWVGDHSGGGSMSNVTWVHGSATIPNSTEWVSPWLTEPITGDRMLSLGWNSTGGTPIGIQGGCWQTSSAADAGTAAPSRTIQQTAPFSIWIEAETYASTPVVAVAGDSLSVGANATLPIHDSVISVHAREVGALPVHYAASGDSMAASLDPGHFKWQQFAGCDAPDSILWAMGSNDVFGDPTLAEMQERHEGYAAVLATITPNIYGATIAPRTANQDAGITATRRAYNTWLGTQPNGIRDLFDFVTPVSADDLTIRPSMDADGTHYNSSGYAAQAAAITRPVAGSGARVAYVGDGVYAIS